MSAKTNEILQLNEDKQELLEQIEDLKEKVQNVLKVVSQVLTVISALLSLASVGLLVSTYATEKLNIYDLHVRLNGTISVNGETINTIPEPFGCDECIFSFTPETDELFELMKSNVERNGSVTQAITVSGVSCLGDSIVLRDHSSYREANSVRFKHLSHYG